MNEDDLKDREASRRKALWTLAHLVPGDPGATSVIDVLNDIEAQERRDNHSAISLADLRTAVLPQLRASGYPIVIEDENPSPGVNGFCAQARVQPQSPKAHTLTIGRDSYRSGNQRCGIWKHTARRGQRPDLRQSLSQ